MQNGEQRQQAADSEDSGGVPSPDDASDDDSGDVPWSEDSLEQSDDDDDSNIPGIDFPSAEDLDDFRLFRSRRDPRDDPRGELAASVVRIKRNDPDVTRLFVHLKDYFDGPLWMRLGEILGANATLLDLCLRECDLDVSGLCVGLKENRCIQTLDLAVIDLRDAGRMGELVPFLSRCPSLRVITLQQCNLGQAGINLLSDALSNRPSDALESLDLRHNRFGDIDLDMLVSALNRGGNFKRFCVNGNGIGIDGCVSLARLLRNRESNIEVIELSDNNIDDECAIVLADSLGKNTKLRRFYLSNNLGMVDAGWSAMLKLVCDNSSIRGVVESNHALHNMGIPLYDASNALAVKRALGASDANLLHASLKLNGTIDGMLVARRKLLWSHARGDLNLGDPSIPEGAVPRILAWFGDGASEADSYLVQYHFSPFPNQDVGTIRLDSVYRFLRSIPDLCQMDGGERCRGRRVQNHAGVKRKLDEVIS